MLIKPGNGLIEGLLLGPLLYTDGHVATDAEAMRDARVQGDLVRLARLDENLLGLVALLGREDPVGLGGGDRQRAGDGGQLFFLDERWVGKEAGCDAVLVVPRNILSF